MQAIAKAGCRDRAPYAESLDRADEHCTMLSPSGASVSVGLATYRGVHTALDNLNRIRMRGLWTST
jgi:hypothetical protein